MKIKPRIAITHGDPAGIGPELIAKLLAMPDLADLADVVLVGDRHVFELGQRQAGVDCPLRAIDMEHPEGWWPGAPYAWFPMETIPPEEVEVSVVSAAAGQSSLRTLERAIDFTRAGLVDAILFGPFNKTSLHLAGMVAEDEHRHIAEYLGFTGHHSEVNMLDELITTRVTSHIALKDVAGNIDQKRVVDAVHKCREVTCEIDDLLEMGFRGRETERVEESIQELSRIESETDDQGMALIAHLFEHQEELSPLEIVYWDRLVDLIGDMADYAEDVGDRLRLLIAR